MKRRYAVILAAVTLLLCVLASCISREASERQQGQAVEVSGDVDYHIVTFYQNGMVIQQISVPDGGLVGQVPGDFAWRDEAGQSVDFTTLTVTRDMDFFVREALDVRAQHLKYMDGVNGLFDPSAYLTRGQLAQIISVLLGDEDDMGTPATFSDVSASDECYAAVTRVGALGIMKGNGDGTFRPNDNVTRAELVTTLCRLMDVSEVAALPGRDAGPLGHGQRGGGHVLRLAQRL